MIVSIIVACIGLAGPLVLYVNGRFTASTARASRMESLSKTIDSLPAMSTEYLALTHVRNKLILDEHYRVYGPKENRYINVLIVINLLLGIGGMSNFYFKIEALNYLLALQSIVLAAVTILTIFLNRKHDKYMEDFKHFIPEQYGGKLKEKSETDKRRGVTTNG